MAKKVIHSGVYQYLEQCGVLADPACSKERIQRVKKEYYKKYKTAWRRNKRKTNRELTIYLDPNELRIIQEGSKKHGRTLTKFVKMAAMAYLKRQFVVPDIYQVSEIKQQLLMNYGQIQKLFEGNYIPYQAGKELLDKYQNLEESVLKSLRQPECLEDRIMSAVRNKPEYKETLRQLIENM